MSYLDLSDNDKPLIKNDILMSDMNTNLFPNDYYTLKEEEEKNDEKSLSEEYNFIKNELFLKDIGSKNYFSENEDEDDDLDDSRRYEITCRRAISNNVPLNFVPKLDLYNPMMSNSQLEPINLNNTFTAQNNNNKKIFNIVKVPKSKQQIFQCLQKKRLGDCRVGKKLLCDWDNIPVPKEKHFHFDRKKHRIVFQKKHLKVIYSIVDLALPFDFNKCFDMIKEHIGDKTAQNYNGGKSFHIIKINSKEKIVTLKDKKILLKQNKIKKRGSSLIENNEKITDFMEKDCKNENNINNASENEGEKSGNNEKSGKTDKKDKKGKNEALFQIN